MTEQDKQLLLQDLCARLPYGVIAEIIKRIQDDTSIVIGKVNPMWLAAKYDKIEDIKPYLRSMSDMTEDEKKEYSILSYLDDKYTQPHDSAHLLDWFYTHHLDFRGLIPKGLALEAKEGMYKTE